MNAADAGPRHAFKCASFAGWGEVPPPPCDCGLDADRANAARFRWLEDRVTAGQYIYAAPVPGAPGVVSFQIVGGLNWAGLMMHIGPSLAAAVDDARR